MRQGLCKWIMERANRGRLVGRRLGMASAEYALLLGLLVVATVAVWGALSESLGGLLCTIANSFSTLPNP